ncbi:hypothetical protein [Endothiovibrio diazotrophicus]
MTSSALAEEVSKLVLRIFEPGVEPYYSRYLVDADWLRIDEGAWSPQYILLDRRQGAIYSVDDEAESIMVIERRAVETPSPLALAYRVEAEPQLAYGVAGIAGEGHQVTVDGQRCQTVASLPGLLPEATRALAEYRTLLAGEHARTVGAIPPELLDGCDLALNIYHAADHLQWGMPLEVWEVRGYRQQLIDFETGFAPEPQWHALPEGYSRFSPGS